MRGRVRKVYAFALTHGQPGWRSSFAEWVSWMGSKHNEESWLMRSGRSLTSFVVRGDRWFDGEGEHWADACPAVEGEGDMGEDMKADSGMLRTVQFQKSLQRVDLSMSP